MTFHSEGSLLIAAGGADLSAVAVAHGLAIEEVASGSAAAKRAESLGIRPAQDLPALLLSQNGKLRVAALRVTPQEIEALAAGEGVAAERALVYGAGWCPDCRNAKRILDDAAVPYDEIDIDRDASAEKEVLLRSDGRRVIPTLALDGRIWAFNPSAPWLRRLVSKVAK